MRGEQARLIWLADYILVSYWLQIFPFLDHVRTWVEDGRLSRGQPAYWASIPFPLLLKRRFSKFIKFGHFFFSEVAFLRLLFLQWAFILCFSPLRSFLLLSIWAHINFVLMARQCYWHYHSNDFSIAWGSWESAQVRTIHTWFMKDRLIPVLKGL